MKVEKLDRLKKKLAMLPKQAEIEIAKAIDQSADDVMSLQRRIVPEDDGDLKSSIRKEKPRTGKSAALASKGLSVEIKAGGTRTKRPIKMRSANKGIGKLFDYALAQEFGTRKMPANPFFWPAWRLRKGSAKSRINRGIRKGIKKVVGR